MGGPPHPAGPGRRRTRRTGGGTARGPAPGVHSRVRGERRDYLLATDAYQAAGKLLDEAAGLPDLAAARARHLGRRVVAREAAAARRPACEPCRLALLAGDSPDVLPALSTARDDRGRPVTVLVLCDALPRQASIRAGTACGSYDPEASGRVLRGEHRTRPAG